MREMNTELLVAMGHVACKQRRMASSPLSHVWFGDGALTATDGGIYVVVRLGEVTPSGYVPAALLRSLGGASAPVTIDGDTMTMGAQTVRVAQNSWDAHPTPPPMEGAYIIGTIPVQDLIRGLEVVKVAPSDPRQRYSQILVEAREGEGFRFVATDGRRVVVDGPYGVATRDGDAPVPISMARLSDVLLAVGAQGDVTVRHTLSHVEFATSAITCFVPAPKFPFPQWRTIVPTGTVDTLAVSRKDLQGMLRGIRPGKNGATVLLRRDRDTAILTVRVIGHDASEGIDLDGPTWDFDGATNDGPALNICVALDYFKDLIAMHRDEEIVLGISELNERRAASGPLVATAKGRQHILMPLMWPDGVAPLPEEVTPLPEGSRHNAIGKV